jgi:hypothetical protein
LEAVGAGPAGITVKASAAICRGHVRTIEDAVEAWKQDHDDAMKVQDLEQMILVCLFLRNGLRQVHRQVFNHLFAGKVGKTQELGRVVRGLDASVLKSFQAVAEVVRWARENGLDVERAGDLDQAIEHVRRLSDDFGRRWPLFDTEQIKEGLAQAARGEFADDEDIQRALQGQENR